MNTGDVQLWLSSLKKTINFETTAKQVFDRLVSGHGPGLLVIYGPSISANKTRFLKSVEAFQAGCPPVAQQFVSPELWALLKQVHEDMYQCVNVPSAIKEFNLDPGVASYRIPLGITVPMALALAASATGIMKNTRIVILCDDLQDFMSYNQAANEQFLVELSRVLDKRSEVTFLGTARTSDTAYPSWNPLPILGVEHVLNLGWD